MAGAIAAVEGVMDSMGMMSGGPEAYLKRAAFGAALGTGVVFAIRPSSMFYDDGTPRPFSFSQTGANYDGSGTGQHSTSIPWWSVPLGTAAFFSVFI